MQPIMSSFLFTLLVVKVTSTPTVVTPLWNNDDIASVELDDETQVVYDDLIVNDNLLTNETYWLMKLHEDINKWYVYVCDSTDQ